MEFHVGHNDQTTWSPICKTLKNIILLFHIDSDIERKLWKLVKRFSHWRNQNKEHTELTPYRTRLLSTTILFLTIILTCFQIILQCFHTLITIFSKISDQ